MPGGRLELPRVVSQRSLNSYGSLITVSTRSTQPCLSYILIQFPFIQCFTRAAAQRRFPVVHDLTREAAVKLVADEGEHVFGAETERRVAEQPPVESRADQCDAVPQEDLGIRARCPARPIPATPRESYRPNRNAGRLTRK
jgi:hypothetical protein